MFFQDFHLLLYTCGVHEWCTRVVYSNTHTYHKKQRRIEGRIEGGRKENGRGGRREDRRINGTQSVRVRSEPEMKED